MAGLFTSILDVRGWEAFVDAVAEVLASARRSGLVDAPMAVLVQPLLQPALGGVLFGADPLTGEQDRLLVLRSIGGGHYVAGGESLPQAGRWTVQLAAAAGDWRLASPVDAGASTWRIEARPGGVQ